MEVKLKEKANERIKICGEEVKERGEGEGCGSK